MPNTFSEKPHVAGDATVFGMARDFVDVFGMAKTHLICCNMTNVTTNQSNNEHE